MINPLSAKLTIKEIGECHLRDEFQGWDDTVKLTYLPDPKKARTFEQAKEVHARILARAPSVAGELVTCSENDANAAMFVSASSKCNPQTGDKYTPDDLIIMMFASPSVYKAVHEAYWLICRDGLTPEEWAARNEASDAEDGDPKD